MPYLFCEGYFWDFFDLEWEDAEFFSFLSIFYFFTFKKAGVLTSLVGFYIVL
jgi:hypothetical protein